MKRVLSIAATLSMAVLLGCEGSADPGSTNAVRYDPPNTEFARTLGITPPVTSDQAMAIAAAAVSGTALGTEQEMERGELLFEVRVQTSEGVMEVEVRASDGGVVEIEPAADGEPDDDDGPDDS